MTMTEIVAKRIHQDQTTGRSWESEAETMKRFYRLCAKSAIVAMREPTEEMLRAADLAPGGVDGCPIAYGRWQAMIGEALK